MQRQNKIDKFRLYTEKFTKNIFIRRCILLCCFSLHRTFYLYGTRQKIWIIKIYPDPDNGWDSETPRVSLIYRVRLAGYKQDIKAKDWKERSGLCRKSKVRPKTNEVYLWCENKRTCRRKKLNNRYKPMTLRRSRWT